MAWTAREVAFIIGFADYCIHHNLKYQNTVENELQKSSSRGINYTNVTNKLSRISKSNGITNISLPEHIAQGTDRIDITSIPADVRAELDGWREEWGFPLLAGDAASPGHSSLEGSGSRVISNEDVVSALMCSCRVS
jgi:hypothetical protein